jgi:hypothetical protein
MIRESEGCHASLFQKVVDFYGLAIALLTQVLEPWSVEHSRSFRVKMEIATHGIIVGVEYEQPVKREQNLRECAHGTY